MQQNKTIVCKDGFSMSVQANETAYCEPRIDNAEKYTAVEIGFPNWPEPLLMEWAEDPKAPTGLFMVGFRQREFLWFVSNMAGLYLANFLLGFHILGLQNESW